MEKRQVIIIGGGPAGLTAGVYCGRALLNPLVFTGLMPGGQIVMTTVIENYPGFPEGRTGIELMNDFKKQAERFKAEMKLVEVSEVDLTRRPFYVRTTRDEYEADSIIIATGAKPRRLGIPGESKMFGRGVSSCATCDGALYRDKDVMVVGGGDTAMEDSLFLTRFAGNVTVAHRRDKLRACKVMQQKAMENDKIKFEWNTVVEEVLTDGTKLTGARLKDVESGETREMPIDGFFLAIGHDPQSELFREQLDMDRAGYIKLTKGSATSVEGVFAAGDVCDPRYKQVVVAAASGCKAAIDCEKYLETLQGK